MGFGDWLLRVLGGSPHSPAPQAAFTYDLSVQLPAGRTPEQVVDFVLSPHERGQESTSIVAALGTEFELSAEDAELAIDRVGAGIVRAMTGNPANCPDRANDPIAWASFQRAIGQRS